MSSLQNDKLQIFPVCPTRDESDIMKGLFILLIVLAHNALLVPTTSSFQHYFYQFHYFTFFILPFFYPSRELTLRRMGNYIVRFYVPYFWLFLLTFIGYSILWKQREFELSRFFSAFFGAEISQIKEVTGFHFLWFLPAFCLFSMLRDLFLSAKILVRVLLIMIALFVHFSVFMGLPSYYDYRIHIPLGLVQAFYFFPVGVITVWVLRYIPRFRILETHEPIHKWYARCLALLIFTLLSLDFMNDGELGASTSSGELRNMLLAVFFFILIYLFREYLRHIAILKLLGQNSLEIYLFHVFVYNGLIYLFYFFGVSLNSFVGFTVFIFTLILSLSIVILLKKVNFVQKILFPKELLTLKDVLK